MSFEHQSPKIQDQADSRLNFQVHLFIFHFYFYSEWIITLYILGRVETSDAETLEKLNDIKKQTNERKKSFRRMEDVLPHENGWILCAFPIVAILFIFPNCFFRIYLKIILGSVNVSLLSRKDKWVLLIHCKSPRPKKSLGPWCGPFFPVGTKIEHSCAINEAVKKILSLYRLTLI